MGEGAGEGFCKKSKRKRKILNRLIGSEALYGRAREGIL